MKPETKFRVVQVLPFLKTLKHTHAEPIQQKAINGSADYILCCGGNFVWLELKKDGKTPPEPLQKFKASNVRRCGGIDVVTHPENWKEIKLQLSALDKGEPWKK